jgi:hypothetical protein
MFDDDKNICERKSISSNFITNFVIQSIRGIAQIEASDTEKKKSPVTIQKDGLFNRFKIGFSSSSNNW